MSRIGLVGSASWLLVCTALAICHLNHPRLWIQDILCSVSLYWLPAVLAGFVAVLWRCIRTASCSLILLYALVVQGFLVYRVSALASPYLHFSRWAAIESSRSVDLPMLLSHTDFTPGGAQRLAGIVSAQAPGIIILVGQREQLMRAQESLPAYPFVVESEPAGLLVLSRFEPSEESRVSLGLDSLPGLFLNLKVPEVGPVLLGALDLIPAASQDDFFASKVTSRRLATLMRYRKEPRIVVGNFNATPFAPLVNMYRRQLSMRSVMFGQGFIRTFDLTEPFVRLPLDNAFVSKDVAVIGFELFEGVSEHRSTLAWRVRVPRAQ